MTGLQIFLTYAVSWWMVLFMVLPYRATPPAVPVLGHASGAPEHPRIRRKLLWTTGFALIPTVLIYFGIGILMAAQADDNIYHAGGKKGCEYGVYHAPADINATDGSGAGGKSVTPATIGVGGAVTAPTVDLNINGDNYVRLPQATPQAAASNAGNSGVANGSSPNAGVNAPNSYLGLGKVAVQPDGSVTLDGKTLTPRNDGCADAPAQP
ncbi:MAG: DUF1467 family protein [Rickettsiales bacterium]